MAGINSDLESSMGPQFDYRTVIDNNLIYQNPAQVPVEPRFFQTITPHVNSNSPVTPLSGSGGKQCSHNMTQVMSFDKPPPMFVLPRKQLIRQYRDHLKTSNVN